MTASPARGGALGSTDTLLLTAVFTGAVGSFALWAGAAITAIISGRPVPGVDLAAGVRALTQDRGNPSAAWGQPVGSTWLYWTCTASVLTVLVAALAACWWVWARNKTSRAQDPRRLHGLASRAEVARAAGAKALIARAGDLRPSLAHPRVGDLGHRLGRGRGVDCYASVEDSMVLLGPPRSGKGVHIVINAILDAPGAVITTSTRPDNLTAALAARAKVGPVAVFDPQGLAPGIPSATRWSPIRGCADPQTAMIRAKALTAGAAGGTTDSSFWQSSAEAAVRALLHAAALGDRTPADLFRWSLSAAWAREAGMVLSTHPKAAPSWHQGLEAIVEPTRSSGTPCGPWSPSPSRPWPTRKCWTPSPPGQASSSTHWRSCGSAARCSWSAPPPGHQPQRGSWVPSFGAGPRSPAGWPPPAPGRGSTLRCR